VSIMGQKQIEISSTESIIFQLLEKCDHPQFKYFVGLLKAT